MSEKKEKISLKEVKKISPSVLLRMINKAKKYLKKDKTWIDVCKEYGETPDVIDYIPVMFGDLDVSAKTNKGIIILNYKLLCDGDFIKDFAYLIHEGTHFLQQTCNDKPTKSSDDGDYLKNEFEQEAFQEQVEYISNHEGENKAEKYVDDLLEYHDVDNKKEKKEIEEVLTEKI